MVEGAGLFGIRQHVAAAVVLTVLVLSAVWFAYQVEQAFATPGEHLDFQVVSSAAARIRAGLDPYDIAAMKRTPFDELYCRIKFRQAEYRGIYRRFVELIANGVSDVDLSPLVHVADAFMLGRRRDVEPFIED